MWPDIHCTIQIQINLEDVSCLVIDCKIVKLNVLHLVGEGSMAVVATVPLVPSINTR